MLLSSTCDEEGNTVDHPYLYGRVTAIFHVLVEHVGQESTTQHQQKIDVCWICWYSMNHYDKDASSFGFTVKRLYQVRFLHDTNLNAFGFIDPNDIIQAVHFIPNFAAGETTDDEGNPNKPGKYWHYYVNW